MGLDRDVLVMLKGATATVTENVLDAVITAVETPVSVTVAVTEKLPALVGAPLMAPAVVAESPSGSPLTDQENLPVPPLAVRLAEYATLTVPSGSEVVVTVRAPAAMVTGKVWVTVALAESVTVTLTVDCPAVVGVPLTEPLAKLSPSGSPVTTKVYGGVPPVAPIWPVYATPTCPLPSVEVAARAVVFTVRLKFLDPGCDWTLSFTTMLKP